MTYRSTWGAPEPDAMGRARQFLRFGPAVQLLIAANLATLLLCLVAAVLGVEEQWIYETFGVSLRGLLRLHVWQPLTYMFLHSLKDVLHILLNILLLWIFGQHLEAQLGRRAVLTTYLACGLGGAFLQILVQGLTAPGVPAVGASGAVYGVFARSVLLDPDRTILFFLVIPMRARLLLLLLVVMELLYALWLGAQDPVARWAHLGGVATAWCLHGRALGWRGLGWRPRARGHARRRGSEIRLRGEVDRILEKIGHEGMDRLTRRERRFLKKASRTFQRPDGGG